MFIVRRRGRPATRPPSFIGIMRYPVSEPRLYIVQAPLGMWTNAGAGGEYLASGDAHGLSVHVCANDCDKPPFVVSMNMVVVAVIMSVSMFMV